MKNFTRPNVNEIILFDNPTTSKPAVTQKSTSSYLGMYCSDKTWGIKRVKKGTDYKPQVISSHFDSKMDHDDLISVCLLTISYNLTNCIIVIFVILAPIVNDDVRCHNSEY